MATYPQPNVGDPNWGAPLNAHMATLSDGGGGGINTATSSSTTDGQTISAGTDDGYTYVNPLGSPAGNVLMKTIGGVDTVILDGNAGNTNTWEINNDANGITPIGSANELTHILDNGTVFRGDLAAAHSAIFPTYTGSRPDIEVAKLAATAEDSRIESSNASPVNFAAVGVDSDSARLSVIAHGTGRTLTRFGMPLAGTSEIVHLGDTSGGGLQSALVVGTKLADDIVFGTSDVERMRITWGGLVGINTSTPKAPLHIVSDASQTITVEGLAPTIFFKETDGNVDENWQLRANQDEFKIQTQNDAGTVASTKFEVYQSGGIRIASLPVATTPGVAPTGLIGGDVWKDTDGTLKII